MTADWVPSDAAVEVAARALAQLEPGEEWPPNAALGGNLTGTRDDEYRSAMEDSAREVLQAAYPLLVEEIATAIEAQLHIDADRLSNTAYRHAARIARSTVNHNEELS